MREEGASGVGAAARPIGAAAVLAVLSAAACGGGGGGAGSGGKESATAFVQRITTEFARGQTGRLWDELLQPTSGSSRAPACRVPGNEGWDTRASRCSTATTRPSGGRVELAALHRGDGARQLRRRDHDRDDARGAGARRVALVLQRLTGPPIRRGSARGRLSRESRSHYDEWPRVESNHRAQLRRLPLCPLSYGAVGGRLARDGGDRDAAARLSLVELERGRGRAAPRAPRRRRRGSARPAPRRSSPRCGSSPGRA